MLRQKAQIAYLAQQRKNRAGGNQFCMYPGRVCMQNRAEGFDYCARHVLEDKTAPFKQCSYMSTRTNRRCNRIAKSERKDSYCVEHAKRSALLRPRPVRRNGPRATPETLLEELDKHRSGVGLDSDVTGLVKPGSSKPLGLQDFLSEEESEDENRLVEKTWKGDVESDDESVDSDQEDALKHAGVYTAEEVALITREKLIRLQSLYIDQFKRLQHVLQERRRRYLQNARPDRDAACVSTARLDPSQRQQYDKLMALKRYHRSHGVEAILHRRSKERRLAQTEGGPVKERSQRCLYTSDDNTKCQNPVLPLSKFCTAHILHDTQQVLFAACRFGGRSCGRPAPLAPVVCIKEGAPEPRCPLHVPLVEYVDRVPDDNELDDEPGTPGLDTSEEQTLATLARTLGDELQTPDTSNARSQMAQEVEEAPLDESLLCLDAEGVPTLEEALIDTGLHHADDLVMMMP